MRNFNKKAHGKYKKIIAFEPDTYNYECLSRLKQQNVIKKNIGLWDENRELSFTNGGGCGSKIFGESTDSIKVMRLDDVEECRDATYIKMDIEGAERRALKGAENIIKQNHPKLAICLYHSDEDMICIPEYIHKLEPRYQIYVRHHSRYAVETVLYAVYK